MQLEEFIGHLPGARGHGNEWKAHCPAHEDRVSSLSVTKRDGKILIHCHAGCSANDVIAAMGLTWAEIAGQDKKDKPEAQYDYTDEKGNVLFSQFRFPGKKFQIGHTDPETDEFVWNLDGVRRVVYRLPEVIEAAKTNQTIYIVEGEKDVESLRSISKVATCNPLGAGKWRDEYADDFGGMHFIIIADKDEPGRKHAAAIKESLLKRGGRYVHVLQARSGKDVSDHLAAGHDITELVPCDLNNTQRHYQPLDLFAPVPPIAWVVENVVVAGEATLLIADGGAGKSFFALAMSLAVAGGEHFLDQPTQQGRVMYVDEEGSPDLALQRLYQLGATDEQKRNLDYLNFEGVDIVKHPEKLIEDAKLTKPKLIVIDSHAKVTRVGEENSNNEMGRAWDDGFLPLARQTKAAVLVIHHTNGFGGARGASQIRNSADQVLTMKKQEDQSQKVYASKPRRIMKSLHFRFEEQPFGHYALVPVVESFGIPVHTSEWGFA